MNDDTTNSSISENSTKDISEQVYLKEETSTNHITEDVEAASSLSEEHQTEGIQGPLSHMYSELKSYILTSEDDINLQCDMSKDLVELGKEPMFVIVDSSGFSEPSSKEMVINDILNKDKPTVLNKYVDRNVLYSDMPSTSNDTKTQLITSAIKESVSWEELQMIDINLQSENEIPVDQNENDNESIVLAYIKKKDLQVDIDGTFKKRSSLLESVPKMETIPEGEQFVAFRDPSKCEISPDTTTPESTELSDSYLDIHIPSYPGSPRSLESRSALKLHASSNEAEDFEGAIHLIEKESDFLDAAETGDEILVKQYMRKEVNIHQLDQIGRNALHLAVTSGNLKCVQILLKAGVNPNVKDNVGMTPLSLCLLRRASLPMISILFDHGAVLYPRINPMDAGLFLEFIMMSVPTNEEMDVIDLLVQHGGDVNDPAAPGGRQALHFAAMSNNCTLIKYLVQLGADLYDTNDRGETPKDVAVKFKCHDAEILLQHFEDIISLESL